MQKFVTDSCNFRPLKEFYNGSSHVNRVHRRLMSLHKWKNKSGSIRFQVHGHQYNRLPSRRNILHLQLKGGNPISFIHMKCAVQSPVNIQKWKHLNKTLTSV